MRVLGILNITEDSFSDGGQFLEEGRAVAHAQRLLKQGADIVDVGPASSHPDSKPVPISDQIDRLRPIFRSTINPSCLSIDSPSSEVQRFALEHGVGYLNDIQGFSDPQMYPRLANSITKLIVMHSVSMEATAKRVDVPAKQIVEKIFAFFDRRIHDLTSSGISPNRIVIDPGMGFFLGINPETSLEVLRHIPVFRERWKLPILISVSRKSFLQKIIGQSAVGTNAATLAAELFCFEVGADYVRTHEPQQLSQATAIWRSIKDTKEGKHG